MTAYATFTDNKLQRLKETPPYSEPIAVVQTLNNLMQGRSNAVGTFTLDANVGSTVVVDTAYSSQQAVFLVPTTANAATEFGAGTWYLSARSNGQFTITHVNNAQTDRTFLYVRLG